MAVYNDTFMDNATNVVDIFVGAGSSIGDPYLIGNLLLMSFFVVFLILGLRNNFAELLLIDSFITTILAILFFVAGFVQVTTVIFPILVLIFVLIFMNIR